MTAGCRMTEMRGKGLREKGESRISFFMASLCGNMCGGAFAGGSS